jgi:hypothetical protein
VFGASMEDSQKVERRKAFKKGAADMGSNEADTKARTEEQGVSQEGED